LIRRRRRRGDEWYKRTAARRPRTGKSARRFASSSRGSEPFPIPFVLAANPRSAVDRKAFVLVATPLLVAASHVAAREAHAQGATTVLVVGVSDLTTGQALQG